MATTNLNKHLSTLSKEDLMKHIIELDTLGDYFYEFYD
jgi:hypothetical protein